MTQPLHRLPTDMLDHMLLDPDLDEDTIEQIEDELERRSDPHEFHHDDTPSLIDHPSYSHFEGSS